MATSKKAKAISSIKEATIKLNVKKFDALGQPTAKAESKAKAKASEIVNNSDLCKFWAQYGEQVAFVIGIFPSFGKKAIKEIKKGFHLVADAIETNCSTPLPE